jgi:predicted nucleic acid-binding protein
MAYLLGRSGARRLINPLLSEDWVDTSIVVYGEIVERIIGFQDYQRHEATLRGLLRSIRPLPVTYGVMLTYARIRRSLRPQGQLIGDIDILIAATASERDSTVLTIDGDFARVPGLKVDLRERSDLR